MQKEIRIPLPVLAYIGFLGVVDTSYISPIISSYAISLGATPSIAGLIAGLYAIIAIPSSFILGLITDKIGRKNALQIGILADIIIIFLYILSSNYLMLALVRAIHAFLDSFIFPSALGMIGEYFRRIGLPLSIFWSFTALGIILASGSATFLLRIFGFQIIFYVIIGALIIGFIIVNFLNVPALYKSNPGHSIKIIQINFKDLFPYYFSMFAIYFIIGTVVGSLSPTLIKLYNFEEARAASYTAMFMAISTSLAIPFFFFSYKMIEKNKLKLTISIGLITAILSSILIYFNLALIMIIISSILFGISLGNIFLSTSYGAVSIKGEAKGTSSGILQSFSLIGVAIGAPISGYILEIYTSHLQFLISSLPSLIALIILFFKKI